MISPPLYGFASRCRASCASDKALQQHDSKKSFKADPSTLVFSRIICSQVCIRTAARQVQTLRLRPTYRIMNTHTRGAMHVAMLATGREIWWRASCQTYPANFAGDKRIADNAAQRHTGSMHWVPTLAAGACHAIESLVLWTQNARKRPFARHGLKRVTQCAGRECRPWH